MSATATSVLEAPELQLPDDLFPELIYLVDRDTAVLGSAPAEDWTRFERDRQPIDFEIDTSGWPSAVLGQDGALLAKVASKAPVTPGDVFVLTP